MDQLEGESRTGREFAGGVTARAVVLGALLALLINLACPYSVCVMQAAGLTSDYITAGALFLFFVLVALGNTALKVINRRWGLAPAELLLVYIMMIVASAIPTWGLVSNLLCILTRPFYFDTPQNRWAELIQPHLPDWIAPHDPLVAKHFYEGAPAGQGVPWEAWRTPLLMWAVVMLAVYAVMISLMVILRKQWVDRERLGFPLTQVPLELVKQDHPGARIPSLLRSPLFWLGFVIPVVLLSFSGLNHYFHYVPTLRLMSYVRLFRQTVYIRFFINFAIIGLAYLLHLHVAFSFCFFHLLARVQTGLFNMVGYSIGRNDDLCASSAAVSHQGVGAMIVLVAFGLWTARRHLADVARKAFLGARDVDDSDEILSYRAAVCALLGGTAVVVYWLWAGGMPLLGVLTYLFGAFVVFLAITRVVAEGGVGYTSSQMLPQPFTVYALGSDVLEPGGLTGLALTYSWASEFRTSVMASVANSLKLAQVGRLRKRPLFWVMVLAISVGFVSAAWMILTLCYTHGGINLRFLGVPDYAFRFLDHKLNNPVRPSDMGARWAFTGVGGLVMALLMLARQRYLWWPIHYIGFVVGDTWVMGWAWFSVFLGGLFKAAILKYGGVRAFRALRPFFLGLILGQISCGGLWMIIDLITGAVGNFISTGVA